MNWFILATGILAVWRITFMLSMEEGPYDIFYRLRRKAGAGFFGSLLNCFFCLSVWVALPFGIWFGETIGEMLLMTAALSGGACIIERFADRELVPPATRYYEEDAPKGKMDEKIDEKMEEKDGMLR